MPLYIMSTQFHLLSKSVRDYTHIDESSLYDIRIEKCFGMIVSLTESEQDTTQESITDPSEISSG